MKRKKNHNEYNGGKEVDEGQNKSKHVLPASWWILLCY
jgi:hypothetical protein